MDAHALRVLEFQKVKEILLDYAASPLGREAVEALHPSTSIDEIRFTLREVSEMSRLWETNREPPLDGLYDVREPLRRCGIPGAVLDPAELIVIGETVKAARHIRSALRKIRDEAPHIRVYGEQLIPHPDLEEALARVFDEQGNIRDSASHELLKIRRAIRDRRSALVTRIERLIRGSWKEYLQDSLYTQREGRYVLPVDAHFQNKVHGIIHDRSTSGTTVYIEPIELVEDGNRLKELYREEEIEIRKILYDLTAMIASRREDLFHNLEVFRQLDFIAAKARVSLKFQWTEPVIKSEGPLVIVNGRHPLLYVRHGKEKVVPLNLSMPPDVRGLVITGPNTGGKTVVLKTVGLLVLMAQSGLHIPADAGSELPVFQTLGADIGDEQSLEQNLSTFSSHIGNIRALLAEAGPQGLVLLDELGSGTDPVEGGALATSILRQLYDQQATFLSTTHLQELKLFAHGTPGVENGAMEFDLHTLQPTYAFTMGLPGQSNAIQIADRLGIPPSIIQRARAELAEKGSAPEDLLTQLGEELRSARTFRWKAEQELVKARNLQKESERRLAKAGNEAQDILRRAERKAQGLIQELEQRLADMERQQADFQKQWREKLSELVHHTSQPAPPESILAQVRKELEAAKKQIEKTPPPRLEEAVEREEWSWDDLRPGARVWVAGFSGVGVVREVVAKKKVVEIGINSMSLRINADRILAILSPETESASVLSAPDVFVERPPAAAGQVEVIGLTVDEMTPIVQKFVDHAFLSGLPYVTIVHGHGTGTLRRAIRGLLSENPVVKSFQNGSELEGGNGVTVVHLKQVGSV